MIGPPGGAVKLRGSAVNGQRTASDVVTLGHMDTNGDRVDQRAQQPLWVLSHALAGELSVRQAVSCLHLLVRRLRRLLASALGVRRHGARAAAGDSIDEAPRPAPSIHVAGDSSDEARLRIIHWVTETTTHRPFEVA